MFDQHILRDAETGLLLDLTFAPAIPWDALQGPMDRALRAMSELEAGAVANPDEQRRVGHYWLRAPELAPEPELRDAILAMQAQVAALGPAPHTDVLLVGIGGSALGPLLVGSVLEQPGDPVRLHLLDNTDPEGFARVLAPLDLSRTVCVVVSKSGGTPETHNGMLAAMAAWRRAGLSFEDSAIAITTPGSALDRRAAGWRARFPLWDWVGGRVSVTAAVGLVPMALCGWDWRSFLAGAAAADRLTRRPFRQNPAAWLAAAWHTAGNGRGDRALVVEPYRDRFLMLSRHLQQVIMESLGKELDREGRVVHQGLAVYGNKGSTDQHAILQQIRDGRNDTFVHFLETTRHGPPTPIDDGYDASDTLVGLMLGTRAALAQTDRPSLTLSVPDASARTLGLLIALFERAVGLYGELININAYHQPGVEAGKRAAREAMQLQRALEGALTEAPTTAEALAASLGADPLTTWRLLVHLSHSGRAQMSAGDRPSEDRFHAAKG